MTSISGTTNQGNPPLLIPESTAEGMEALEDVIIDKAGRVDSPVDAEAKVEFQNILERHCYRIGALIRKHNWDWWTIHMGLERAGKSTEAMWRAIYTSAGDFLDHWEERIAFDGLGFFRLVQEVPPGVSVIFDEAGAEWLRTQWYQETNINLIKALVICGWRNLDVHVVSPDWELLPSQVVRRAKDWDIVDVGPNYERGFLEVRKPSKMFFKKRKIPFLPLRFYHRFMPLMPSFYHDYEKFKIEKSVDLLDRYGAIIESEVSPKKSFAEQVKDTVDGILKKKLTAELRSGRGRVDFNRVRLHFDVPEQVARAVAGELNRRYPGRKGRGSPDKDSGSDSEPEQG